MDIEAYKVAVKLHLSENVTAGLLAVSRQFASAEMSAAKLRNELTSIGKMAAVGGGLLAVGLTVTKGLDAAMKSAREVAKAQADFRTLNLSASQMAEVNAKATILSHQVLGSTIAGNIRLVQDLHTAFGNLEHALEVAPQFTRYETAVKMALGERAADGMVNFAAKALEHRGGRVVNDPVEFNKELSLMSQVQFATKNRVSPRDFYTASQTGKMAYASMSPEYLYGSFAGLMSMIGGDRAGTEAMTYVSSLIGGHMDKKAKGFLSDIGLYDEGVSKARLSSMRQAMKGMNAQERNIYMQSLGGESILSGGLKSQYRKMASESPDQFVSLMVDKIKKKYGRDLSDDEIKDVFMTHFNRSTADYLGQLWINRQKFKKDSAVFRHAMMYDTALYNYQNSPDGAGIALSSAWTNLKAVIGLQLLPSVTKATLGLANFVNKLSDLAEKNPQLVKFGTYAVAAAAGLATISGGILMLGATIAAARLVSSLGIVSSIVTMLGGPLVWAGVAAAGAGYLVYKNWDKIKPVASQMGDEFKGIMHDIWQRAKGVGDYIKSWSLWGNLEGAFNSFSGNMELGFTGLYDYIIGILNKIPGVNILSSSEISLQNRAMGLLADINHITGADRRNVRTPLRGTYGGDYANAMLGNNGGNGLSMAAGMRQASNSLAPADVYTGNYKPVEVTSKTYLDGKLIAEVITQYQTKQASRAPTGTSGVDSTMTLIHAGMSSMVAR